MRTALLLVALLIAPLGAGCLGAPGKSMTVRDGLADAEAAAKAWADGATPRLVGALAIEPFRRINESHDGHESEFVVHLDRTPGDGEAPGWLYGFAAGDRCVIIALAAGLGVLAEGYETCEPDAEDLLPTWSVDSDEVADILAAHPDWPAPGESTLTTWELEADDGLAVWTVAAESFEGDRALARVNAADGSVLSVEARKLEGVVGPIEVAPGPAGPEGAEHGTQTATDDSPLLRPGDGLESTVELEADGGVLDVQVAVSQAVGTVTLRVVGPVGELESTAVTAPGLRRTYEGLPAGEYSVRLTADVAAVLASQTVTGAW